MSKKMEKLVFVGACEAEYWDEQGPHLVNPGDTVKFTPKMAEIRVVEECWKKPKTANNKGGEK